MTFNSKHKAIWQLVEIQHIKLSNSNIKCLVSNIIEVNYTNMRNNAHNGICQHRLRKSQHRQTQILMVLTSDGVDKIPCFLS